MAIYGIDLGTTNSLIGLHKTGFLSDIVPSCVNLNSGEAGTKFFDDMTATRSFKIDMSMGVEGIVPRAASQCVLRELVAQVKDDKVKDVVISVPAYFSDSQRAATVASAEAEGLNVKGLVNEPTAAAMYIAQNKKGLFVVFDLGGGTFDVSIIDSRFGAYDVQATDGCVLGGDNLDQNLMRHFIKLGHIPIHRLNKSEQLLLQHIASKQKIKMQTMQTTFEIDLSQFSGGVIEFTPENYNSIMKMTFAETINLTKRLISTWIPSTEVFDILLVGGSTHCPFLQRWLTEELGHAPAKITYDPDRVVAQGAALYASLIEEGKLDATVSDVTKPLSIGLYDGTVSTIVEANSKIPLSVEKIFSNPVAAESLELDLYQGNGFLTTDNEKIGTLIWNYDSPMPARMGQVIVNIDIDSSGVITFSAHELLHEPKVVVLKR